MSKSATLEYTRFSMAKKGRTLDKMNDERQHLTGLEVEAHGGHQGQPPRGPRPVPDPPQYQFDAQELSGFSWPMFYRIFVREGYYFDKNNKQNHFVTSANGIDGKRKVSTVLIRAAVLLLVMGGVGYRLASWLLKQLFHVDVSKSSLQRWVKDVLKGVWRIFEDSEDEEQAKQALKDLKAQPIDSSNPEPFFKVIHFLEEYFPGMTTFLRDKEVKRCSLAETGMRTLRRLEVAHDGFRSDEGRENFLRIYQAIKYLGWSICPSTDPMASPAPG